MVQWRMLRFSAPTSINNDPLNDGVLLEKYNLTVNWTFQGAFILPYWKMNTPRSCLMRSTRAMLKGMTEKVWDPDREMKGWELGGRPDLLRENEDGELFDARGPFGLLRWLQKRVLAPPFQIKAKDGESFSLLMPFAKKEVEVKRRKETDDIKEGHDVNEKFRMVIQRMASERRVESGTAVYWRKSKFSRAVVWSKEIPKGSKWKEITKVLYEIGLLIKDEAPRDTRAAKQARKGRRTSW